jgi:signal transduction histidine kinase
MRTPLPGGATVRLVLAATLILAPGAGLAYLGYTALADQQESMRATYGATATLLRDRLGAEVTSRIETIGRTSPPPPDSADSPDSARQWLRAVADAHPSLGRPFIVAGRGRLATADVWSGWPDGPTLALSGMGATALRAGEIAESADRDLDAALRHYRHAESLATSPGSRAFARSRVGRTLFKQRRFTDSVRAYQSLIDSPEDQKIHGLPLAVIARLQMVDALVESGRDAEARAARADLLRWMLDHPWDLQAGYGYELERGLRSAPDAARELAGRAGRLREAIALLGSLHPRLDAIASDNEAPRSMAIGNESAILVTVAAGGKPLALGFVIDAAFVAGILETSVLTGIDLGPNLQARLIDQSGRPSAGHTTIQPLATADMAPILSGWRIALADRHGRTLEEVSARERWTSAALVGGGLLLLIVGVVVTGRAWMREAQLARLRTDFVSNVSHELKTPLALIRMSGETLESGLVADQAKQREFHGIIRRESERLTHLIDNVLDTAKIEAGTRTFTRTRMDLVELVRDVLGAYTPLLSRQGFAVDTVLPSTAVPIDADRDGVSQALVNLLQNAIKYSADSRQLRIAVSRAESEVHLSVTDRGIGITPDQLPRIFERYYRGATDGLSMPAGSGLGLPIVQHLMRAHGGRVDVESRPGQGSTFSLVFPVPS